MRGGMRLVLAGAAALCLARTAASAGFPDCTPQVDGHRPYNGTAAAAGGYGPVARADESWDGKPLVVFYPTARDAGGGQKFPLVVFMHGTSAELGMYLPNLQSYAAHGFVVVFPYIWDAKHDKWPIVTNTNGEYILHGLEFAVSANKNVSSPLHEMIDLDNVVLAGHSMGATCSIAAGSRCASKPSLTANATIRLVVTQHPGICGPFGPPPSPNTWMPADLKTLADTYPVLFTTATNDGAFWPAPYTAQHELGCFSKALNGTGGPPKRRATFVQFSADACNKDNLRPPYDDSGHDCPFKNGVETPWVLTAMKLYAQQRGAPSSGCAKMLYGQDQDSLRGDSSVEKLVFLQ